MLSRTIAYDIERPANQSARNIHYEPTIIKLASRDGSLGPGILDNVRYVGGGRCTFVVVRARSGPQTDQPRSGGPPLDVLDTLTLTTKRSTDLLPYPKVTSAPSHQPHPYTQHQHQSPSARPRKSIRAQVLFSSSPLSSLFVSVLGPSFTESAAITRHLLQPTPSRYDHHSTTTSRPRDTHRGSVLHSGSIPVFFSQTFACSAPHLNPSPFNHTHANLW